MGAADIVQLRDKVSDRKTVLKNARKLAKLFLKGKTIFIVNDYIDIAKVSGADGVHIGQDDLPIELVRKLLGKDKIIGVSCHSLKQARQAQRSGADYISIGPVFSTPTKPEYKPVGLTLIKKCKKVIKIPFFAIGGIDPSNVVKVMSCGGQRVVVCRALFKAKELSVYCKHPAISDWPVFRPLRKG
jgi:thiamine-phosphate pyrophosphorylase